MMWVGTRVKFLDRLLVDERQRKCRIDAEPIES